MLIAGTLLSAGAVAFLASRLRHAGYTRLADDVGIAVDTNRNELVLAPGEQAQILDVLHECPDVLKPLRDALRARVRGES